MALSRHEPTGLVFEMVRRDDTRIQISELLVIYVFRRLEQQQQHEFRMQSIQHVDAKYGPFYFDQPIDHTDASAGTFKHRYWANTDWYQPGGPVICKWHLFMQQSIIHSLLYI